MLKNEKLAITVLAFLVKSYREAINHGGDYEPISQILQNYLDALEKEGNMSKKEIDILYLKSKVKATEEQLQGYHDKIRGLSK